MFEYDPDASLDAAFDATYDQWRQGWELYHNGDVSEGHISLGELGRQFAMVILEGVGELQAPESYDQLLECLRGLGYQDIAQLIAVDGVRAAGIQALEIQLAPRHSLNNRAMAERALKLAPLVLEHRLSPQVGRYLRMVSQAYILGLGAQVVILSRSVLDSAVGSWYQRKGHEPPPTMKARLDFLTMSRVLAEEQRKRAWTVWLRGNKAIHEDPDATTQVFETLEMAMEAVELVTRDL